jgi:tRNA pseudouridine55 synthase
MSDALNGWIILDKPLGMGSTQGVGAVKRALREGGYPKVKVGHGGTLDPLATGVLPIALGEATKLAGRMLDSDKEYYFSVAFGEETDTLDLEGKAIATSTVRPTRAQVDAILPQFTGAIEQTPPAYSALKVDGARAYDLARAGKDVVLASRSVTIHRLETVSAGLAMRSAELAKAEDGWWESMSRRDFTYATDTGRHERLHSIMFVARVSKGTYIRSLARDIARALGTVGHVIYLRRTEAGLFREFQAISLDILFEKSKAHALEDITLPLRTALDDIPALALTPEQAGALRQGRVLTGIAAPDGLTLATLAETPVALVVLQDGTVKVERGFNL